MPGRIRRFLDMISLPGIVLRAADDQQRLLDDRQRAARRAAAIREAHPANIRRQERVDSIKARATQLHSDWERHGLERDDLGVESFWMERALAGQDLTRVRSALDVLSRRGPGRELDTYVHELSLELAYRSHRLDNALGALGSGPETQEGRRLAAQAARVAQGAEAAASAWGHLSRDDDREAARAALRAWEEHLQRRVDELEAPCDVLKDIVDGPWIDDDAIGAGDHDRLAETMPGTYAEHVELARTQRDRRHINGVLELLNYDADPQQRGGHVDTLAQRFRERARLLEEQLSRADPASRWVLPARTEAARLAADADALASAVGDAPADRAGARARLRHSADELGQRGTILGSSASHEADRAGGTAVDPGPSSGAWKSPATRLEVESAHLRVDSQRWSRAARELDTEDINEQRIDTALVELGNLMMDRHNEAAMLEQQLAALEDPSFPAEPAVTEALGAHLNRERGRATRLRDTAEAAVLALDQGDLPSCRRLLGQGSAMLAEESARAADMRASAHDHDAASAAFDSAVEAAAVRPELAVRQLLEPRAADVERAIRGRADALTMLLESGAAAVDHTQVRHELRKLMYDLVSYSDTLHLRTTSHPPLGADLADGQVATAVEAWSAMERGDIAEATRSYSQLRVMLEHPMGLLHSETPSAQPPYARWRRLIELDDQQVGDYFGTLADDDSGSAPTDDGHPQRKPERVLRAELGLGEPERAAASGPEHTVPVRGLPTGMAGIAAATSSTRDTAHAVRARVSGESSAESTRVASGPSPHHHAGLGHGASRGGLSAEQLGNWPKAYGQLVGVRGDVQDVEVSRGRNLG